MYIILSDKNEYNLQSLECLSRSPCPGGPPPSPGDLRWPPGAALSDHPEKKNI